MVSKAQKAESTPTDKDIVDAGINRMVESLGIDVQKARYKAMRAIAWQAFIEYIDEGIFDDLVERAITNAPDLPSGWELARPVAKKAAKPAAKKSSKKTTKKPSKKAPKAPEPQLEDFEDEDVTDVVSEDLDAVQAQDAPEALPEQTVLSLTEDELEAPATPDSTAVKNATRTQRRRRIRRTR
jgi:hypothetical protein